MSLEMMPLPETSAFVIAGQAANDAAARHVFSDYCQRKAANTIRCQDADLALFAQYLNDAGVDTGNLSTDPTAWRGITWGIVEGFSRWQLLKGYAVDSVNVGLSTVKSYAQLALRAGVLDDEKRRDDGLNVRRGAKKSHSTVITEDQAIQMMTSDGTPKGKRDALLMCLMIEHGLRGALDKDP